MVKFGRFVTGLVLVGATVGAGLGAVVLDATSAGAAGPINVNTTVDSSTVTAANCTPGSEVAGACNLRDALAEAAVIGTTAINLPDPNTIGGSGHIYPILSTAGQLDVIDSGTVTITGTTGQSSTILQMQGAPVTNRVLHVASGTTADITGVTVEGGVSTGSPGGGGILNAGTLNLSSSTVTGNSATSGGGVYLDGIAATLTGDTITANSAGSGGGVTMEDGTNVISGGSVDGNNATAGAAGGGIDIEDPSPGDSASLSNVDVSHNTSGDDGGGLYVGNQSATSHNQVTLTNVTADNNTASGAGGGLYVSNDRSWCWWGHRHHDRGLGGRQHLA